MGIYIFNWKLLRKKLIADMKDPDSNHDFGKDIIPSLLSDEKKLYAYKFKGYWKDVGTIDSLWEANMDLLSKNNELDLNDRPGRFTPKMQLLFLSTSVRMPISDMHLSIRVV